MCTFFLILASSSYITANKKLYVGYPKSIYNEENKNLNIINSADIYVHWANGTELEYAKTATANVPKVHNHTCL